MYEKYGRNLCEVNSKWYQNTRGCSKSNSERGETGVKWQVIFDCLYLERIDFDDDNSQFFVKSLQRLFTDKRQWRDTSGNVKA